MAMFELWVECMWEAQTGVLLLMKALAQQESEVAHIDTIFKLHSGAAV